MKTSTYGLVDPVTKVTSEKSGDKEPDTQADISKPGDTGAKPVHTGENFYSTSQRQKFDLNPRKRTRKCGEHEVINSCKGG